MSKDRLIFALDVSDRKEAEKYVRLLGNSVGCFKIGLELFVKEGPDVLKIVQENSSASIFLDLKLQDIPSTVASALWSATSHGVRFITVHGLGGEQVLQAASDVKGSGLEVLVVTVLTSISELDLLKLGFKGDLSLNQLVFDFAELAKKCGCSGIVCSGEEVSTIKNKYGSGFKVIVPGIRPSWSEVKKDDQSRIITPKKAISNGADFIVVGRPIRNAINPVLAAEKIINEIESALLV